MAPDVCPLPGESYSEGECETCGEWQDNPLNFVKRAPGRTKSIISNAVAHPEVVDCMRQESPVLEEGTHSGWELRKETIWQAWQRRSPEALDTIIEEGAVLKTMYEARGPNGSEDSSKSESGERDGNKDWHRATV